MQIKRGMKLLIHTKTSTASPLKIEIVLINSSHILLWMQLNITHGIEIVTRDSMMTRS